jgi:AcrR family transcriptional regulator
MSTALAPSRKRSNSARQAILTAAFALLEEEGFERLSIEGVAARAGVGKTTIYRWWPTKGVMAVEAFLEAVTPAIAFRRSRSARADMSDGLHQ